MSAAGTVPLSGPQYEIAAEGYRATVAGVGASLRSLSHRGRDLVVPFDAEQIRPMYRGTVLTPWANRITDARYTLDGVIQQLPVTEPERGHALHGLAAWARWEPVAHTADSVTLRTVVEPQTGYPFRVQTDATCTLGADGLSWTVTTTNLSDRAAPYTTAPHPYLTPGRGRVDEWTVTLPVSRMFTVAGDRMLPGDLVDVATHDGGAYDFRAPRRFGATMVDNAFTGVVWDADGVATVRVTTDDGAGVELAWDASCPWLQVYSCDRPEPELHRRGLAVEPMTSPPDAFNSGVDLVRIAPGAQHTVTWRIRAV